ncbi:unnamed protein product, partial [Mesorhabditis belari]|uniref:Ground-like domain-containing protein n=1 Tax=Mesorhabditis belari TaxID=2138241 RepID=A0AAF3EAC5_9BILA
MLTLEAFENKWNLTDERLEPKTSIFWAWNSFAVLTLFMNWISMALIRYGTPVSLYRPYGIMLFTLQICFMLSDFTMNTIRPILKDEQIGRSGRLTLIFWVTGNQSFAPVFTAIITNFLCAVSVCFLFLAIASRRHVQQGIRIIISAICYHLLLSGPFCALSYLLNTRLLVLSLVIFGISQIFLWTFCVFYTFSSKRKIFHETQKDVSTVDFASVASRLYAQITLPLILISLGYFAVLFKQDYFDAFALLCGARTHMNLVQMILFNKPTFPLVSDPFLRTKPMEIMKSDVCNNESIRRIITESMVESASKSKRRISAALQRLHPSATFAVICAMCPFSYISHTTDFCLHATHNVTCYVFRDGKL